MRFEDDGDAGGHLPSPRHTPTRLGQYILCGCRRDYSTSFLLPAHYPVAHSFPSYPTFTRRFRVFLFGRCVHTHSCSRLVIHIPFQGFRILRRALPYRVIVAHGEVSLLPSAYSHVLIHIADAGGPGWGSPPPHRFPLRLSRRTLDDIPCLRGTPFRIQCITVDNHLLRSHTLARRSRRLRCGRYMHSLFAFVSCSY
jgi:hypothetical protein